jgi:hypothetical protein
LLWPWILLFSRWFPWVECGGPNWPTFHASSLQGEGKWDNHTLIIVHSFLIEVPYCLCYTGLP